MHIMHRRGLESAAVKQFAHLSPPGSRRSRQAVAQSVKHFLTGCDRPIISRCDNGSLLVARPGATAYAVRTFSRRRQRQDSLPGAGVSSYRGGDLVRYCWFAIDRQDTRARTPPRAQAPLPDRHGRCRRSSYELAGHRGHSRQLDNGPFPAAGPDTWGSRAKRTRLVAGDLARE